MDQQRQKEAEFEKKFKLLSKKYESSQQECESLRIRVKHLDDLSNMMEPPIFHQSIVAEANAESDPSSD